MLKARADERLGPAVVVEIVSTAHEHAVGEAWNAAAAAVVIDGRAIAQEAFREADVHFGLADVGGDGVRVELHRRRVGAVVEPFGLRPMDGVRRRRAENGADAEVVFDRLHVSEMEDIAVADVVVEGGVLRIEKAFCEDGFGLRKLPMDAVGRDVEEEAFRVRSADGLEALFGRAGGIRVEERREIVGARVSHPDDVVLLRTVEFEDAEIRFPPMDAVVAFGVAGDIRVGRHAGHVPRHAAVVHHVFGAVLDDGVVAADIAFPRGVMDDGDLAEDGMVQRQFRAAGHLRDMLHVP